MTSKTTHIDGLAELEKALRDFAWARSKVDLLATHNYGYSHIVVMALVYGCINCRRCITDPKTCQVVEVDANKYAGFLLFQCC